MKCSPRVTPSLLLLLLCACANHPARDVVPLRSEPTPVPPPALATQPDIVAGPDGRPIYAYEVDGRGHAVRMDDANLPNLLGAPYFGYVSMHDPLYRNTRQFVLSARNPYYYIGTRASGLGSPHTPKGRVWPLGLLAQGFTTDAAAEQRQVLAMLLASDPGDHRLHESFDPSDPQRYTRADFGWPNAFFTEYLAKLAGAPDHPKPAPPAVRAPR